MSGKQKRGICAKCQKGPKLISSVHPITGENICQNCFRKLKTEFQGICTECGKEKDVPYHHPKTREPICPACYQKYRPRGRKIRPKIRSVQSPMPARRHEIRHPGDLIGRGVMDIGSLMVGRIVGADSEGVEVDFNGARERYNQGRLRDLVFFTEAAKDFKEKRLAAARKP